MGCVVCAAKICDCGAGVIGMENWLAFFFLILILIDFIFFFLFF